MIPETSVERGKGGIIVSLSIKLHHNRIKWARLKNPDVKANIREKKREEYGGFSDVMYLCISILEIWKKIRNDPSLSYVHTDFMMREREREGGGRWILFCVVFEIVEEV